MGYYVQPQIDSPTTKAVKTGLQALFTFLVGLVVTIYQVPGVPDAIVKFVYGNLATTLLGVGVPFVIGSGIASLIQNLWMNKK